MKIGLFGGSFNPIHNGHVALAKAFLAQSKLDEVWFLVSPQNPLKENAELLSDTARLSMVRKVLEHEEHLIASDYEFHLPRPSYTWNTLQHLAQDYPDNEFVLLIGGDNWEHFDKWYNADEIAHSYQIMIYPRKGNRVIPSNLPKNITLLNTPLLDISSTGIRAMVAKGEDITPYVPQEVKEDIIKYYHI